MNFFLENSNFSSNFIFSHTAQFLSKINNFFSSESWNIILYCRQIHLVNAPIFWRVSSFEVLLPNKKIAFWNQIQKLARFSSLWVGSWFRHYHCKERPIFDLGLAWFALVTLKTTSTEKKPKKTFWRWDAFSLRRRGPLMWANGYENYGHYDHGVRFFVQSCSKKEATTHSSLERRFEARPAHNRTRFSKSDVCNAFLI